MWKEATPFDNQEGFTEQELFYIKCLLTDGFDVRFTDTHIFSKRNNEIPRKARKKPTKSEIAFVEEILRKEAENRNSKTSESNDESFYFSIQRINLR